MPEWVNEIMWICHTIGVIAATAGLVAIVIGIIISFIEEIIL